MNDIIASFIYNNFFSWFEDNLGGLEFDIGSGISLPMGSYLTTIFVLVFDILFIYLGWCLIKFVFSLFGGR